MTSECACARAPAFIRLARIKKNTGFRHTHKLPTNAKAFTRVTRAPQKDDRTRARTNARLHFAGRARENALILYVPGVWERAAFVLVQRIYSQMLPHAMLACVHRRVIQYHVKRVCVVVNKVRW